MNKKKWLQDYARSRGYSPGEYRQLVRVVDRYLHRNRLFFHNLDVVPVQVRVEVEKFLGEVLTKPT